MAIFTTSLEYTIVVFIALTSKILPVFGQDCEHILEVLEHA